MTRTAKDFVLLHYPMAKCRSGAFVFRVMADGEELGASTVSRMDAWARAERFVRRQGFR